MNKRPAYFDAREVALTPPTPLLSEYKPHHCFLYPLCPALACVFEEEWKRYRWYTHESVCTLVKEATKPKADKFFKAFFEEGGKLLDEIRSVIPVMINQHPILRKELSL